ncbi:MAG: prenyltransferase, partial [Pseudonocardiaceae bacterium]
LVESLLTVTLGLTVSVYCGQPFLLGPWLLVQSTVSATHLMTHYCNEYFDLEADSAHTAPNRWTGGSQVLVQAVLRPVVSLSAAFVMLFVIMLLVVVMSTTPERLIALAAVALAWFYTAPPVRLNYRALGEVTTAAALTIFCPLLASYAQLKYVPPVLFAVCVPLFLVMTARMMVMNFCDRDSDLSVGKRTLPNTVGPRRAALLFVGLQAAAYTIVLVVTLVGVLPVPVGVGMALTAPLAYLVSWRILRDPPSPDDPERATATAHLVTAHAAATGFAAVLGMIVAVSLRQGEAVSLTSSSLTSSSLTSSSLTPSVLACVALFLLYAGLVGVIQVMDARGRDRAGEPLRQRGASTSNGVGTAR